MERLGSCLIVADEVSRLPSQIFFLSWEGLLVSKSLHGSHLFGLVIHHRQHCGHDHYHYCGNGEFSGSVHC